MPEIRNQWHSRRSYHRNVQNRYGVRHALIRWWQSLIRNAYSHSRHGQCENTKLNIYKLIWYVRPEVTKDKFVLPYAWHPLWTMFIYKINVKKVRVWGKAVIVTSETCEMNCLPFRDTLVHLRFEVVFIFLNL